jgi:hypothetical protein
LLQKPSRPLEGQDATKPAGKEGYGPSVGAASWNLPPSVDLRIGLNPSLQSSNLYPSQLLDRIAKRCPPPYYHSLLVAWGENGRGPPTHDDSLDSYHGRLQFAYKLVLVKKLTTLNGEIQHILSLQRDGGRGPRDSAKTACFTVVEGTEKPYPLGDLGVEMSVRGA